MPELGSGGGGEERQPAKLETLLQSDLFQERLEKILPKHLGSERFAAIMLRQLSAVPGLRECDPRSVLSGAMDAAALGLEVGLNGEAYLIPYRDNKRNVVEAQLQIGYLGHMKLAWNSGMISSVDADVVTQEEIDEGRFDFQRGSDGYLRHKPKPGRELTEKTIVYAWAMVWPKGSDRPVWRVLDADEIDRLRNTGRSANSPAWVNHFAEMAMAKALKRVLKWAPKSREVSDTLRLDDEADAGIAQRFHSAKDVAAILPAEAERTAGQRVMDDAAKAKSGGKPSEPPGSSGQAEEGSHQPPPASGDQREPEPVPAGGSPKAKPEQSGLGW